VFPPVICFGRLDALLGVGDLRRLLAPLAPSLDRHDVLLMVRVRGETALKLNWHFETV
jgi:hypothetical protein